jgi:outer membrane biosynthesis protein TonB
VTVPGIETEEELNQIEANGCRKADWPPMWEELAKIARVGGMGEQAFSDCMCDAALRDEILEARLEAQNTYVVESTPSFWINGELRTGVLPESDLDAWIMAAADAAGVDLDAPAEPEAAADPDPEPEPTPADEDAAAPEPDPEPEVAEAPDPESEPVEEAEPSPPPAAETAAPEPAPADAAADAPEPTDAAATEPAAESSGGSMAIWLVIAVVAIAIMAYLLISRRGRSS